MILVDRRVCQVRCIEQARVGRTPELAGMTTRISLLCFLSMASATLGAQTIASSTTTAYSLSASRPSAHDEALGRGADEVKRITGNERQRLPARRVERAQVRRRHDPRGRHFVVKVAV